MAWSQVIYGGLEFVTPFIILELLQRRRELGYQPLGLAHDRPPLKPCSPLDCPVCQRPHPKPLWGHAPSPASNPGPDAKAGGANISRSAPRAMPVPTRCITIGATRIAPSMPSSAMGCAMASSSSNARPVASAFRAAGAPRSPKLMS
jgi:hypothetical protein